MAEDRGSDSLGLFPESDGPRHETAFDRRLSRRSILVLAGVSALAVAVLLVIFYYLSNSQTRDLESQQAALASSWKQAQPEEAQGVDFEMKIGNSDLQGNPTMSFHHSGSVALVTDCLEASSSYLVLSDGSLAIENLTDTRSLGSPSCDRDAVDPLFSASRMSFGGDGWTAYDGAGEKILGGLMEQMPEINTDAASEKQ